MNFESLHQLKTTHVDIVAQISEDQSRITGLGGPVSEDRSRRNSLGDFSKFKKCAFLISIINNFSKILFMEKKCYLLLSQ